MTLDEELDKLEHDLRRLKIEYEVYLNGNAKKPPHDSVFRVQTAIKKFSNETAKLSYRQRFRFNQLVQRHAVHSDLWRRKLREKEEGRTAAASRREGPNPRVPAEAFEIEVSDPEAEHEKVEAFVKAMIAARRQMGESEVSDPGDLSALVSQSVEDLKQSGCKKVKLSLEIDKGRVRFQAAKSD